MSKPIFLCLALIAGPLALRENEQVSEDAHLQASKTDGDLEHKSRDASNASAGTVLDGRYELTHPFDTLSNLGKGTFGEVWKAVDRRNKQVVAVKFVFDPQDFIDEIGGCNYQRKARETAKKLGLPEKLILECIDSNIRDDGRLTQPGKAYIVYELAEGKDLNREEPQWLKSNQEDIAKQLLQAAYIMAESGFNHKDLKPQNIKISRTKLGGAQVKILDFGLVTMTKNDERFSFYNYPWSPPEAMFLYDHGRDAEACPDRPDTWDVWGIAALDYWISRPPRFSHAEINAYKCKKFAHSTTEVRELAKDPRKHNKMTRREKAYFNELQQADVDAQLETCYHFKDDDASHVESWIMQQFTRSSTPLVHKLMAGVLQSPPCARPTAKELYEDLFGSQDGLMSGLLRWLGQEK